MLYHEFEEMKECVHKALPNQIISALTVGLSDGEQDEVHRAQLEEWVYLCENRSIAIHILFPPSDHLTACWQHPHPVLNKYTTQSGPVLLPLPPPAASAGSDALDFVLGVFDANSLRLGQ